jgi:hypothetical protein
MKKIDELNLNKNISLKEKEDILKRMLEVSTNLEKKIKLAIDRKNNATTRN